ADVHSGQPLAFAEGAATLSDKGGHGNYVLGTVTGKGSITEQSINPGSDPENPNPDYRGVTVSEPDDQVYDGSKQEPEIVVTAADGKTILEKGKDCNLYYENNVDATTEDSLAIVKVEGIGNYTGWVTKEFSIAKRSVTFQSGDAAKVFDGSALQLDSNCMTVIDDEANPNDGLVKGETVEYVNFASASTVGPHSNTYEVVWVGDVEGSSATAKLSNYDPTYLYGTLTIHPQSISPTDPVDPGIDPDDPNRPEPNPDAPEPDPGDPEQPWYSGVQVGRLENVQYNGSSQALEPAVTLRDGVTPLDPQYYELSWSDDTTNVGEVTVTVTGRNGFAGTIERTYRITPAPLTVTTPDGSKVYDGSALTSGPATLTGLQGADANVVTVAATGSQTAIGSSTNTYEIFWNGVPSSNYSITEDLGTLTIAAAPVSPLPGNPGGGNGGQTPTPLPTTGTGDDGAAVDAAATDDTTATIEDETVPLAAERTIDDNATPMSAGNGQDCWIHWIMILGIIVTVVYAGVVIGRRSKFTGELKNYEDKILGDDENNQ
ncbi:MAG: MBG domain-containing protein, partial [Eggerthellaceae bacterium]|nr:MBG domain-containing protein [Eggerthellaceae bacterium]